ncbi:DUF6057 family protein [Anaerobaca lacustris]|uniref:DUF6057 family protein n=1 Tax=Anaerobaca lacustris TaxID=3044600 RepID=A0AAW6TZ01_9BACT|nr:DUF6057 family protein [Sedimentisphaerales bacterium M17dextr]
MAETTQARTSKGMTLRAQWLPQNLLFFVLCFLYLWLVVEPHLIYHCFGTILPDAPLFATGRAFLLNRLAVPGGGVLYVAGLLSQGYYHACLGALIIILVALGIGESLRRHLALAGAANTGSLTALPAVAFFLIYSHYKHPLPAALAVWLGLVLALAFEKLAFRRTWVRIATCVPMAAFAFWMGGSGALLVFATTAAVHAIFLRRNWTLAILIPPTSVAVVWVPAQYVFLIAPRRAFSILTPFVPSVVTGAGPFLRVLIYCLYGLAPLAVLLTFVGSRLVAWRRQKSAGRSKKTKRRDKHGASRHKRSFPAALFKPALAAAPIVLMALGLYFDRDELRKPYVLSNYYACEKRWDDVLALGRRLPKGRINVFVNHDILRALYHTGRLPYDMFTFPLNPHALLITHEQRESDLALYKLSNAFLELGHANLAQKLASELLATKDHLGVALETLGQVSLVKGQPDTARIYLNALKRDPIRQETAQSWLHDLDHGLSPDRAAYIERIRSCMPDDPLAVAAAEPLERTLARLLERNPRNKMAFEYLMACYLLTGKVDKIVENLHRLDELGYHTTPTLYEEAVLIHYGAQRQKPDLGRIKISPGTIQRYQRFVQIRGSMQPQTQQATFNLLIREFGTSYFFYFAFGSVGLV